MRAFSVCFVAACSLVLVSACARSEQAVSREARLVQGEYLVTRVMFCGNCHTPWGENGPDDTRAFQGAPTGLPSPLAEYAPAIAGIPGHLTEEQFVSLLVTGKRPDGSSPRDPMPRYRLSQGDALAVAAYIDTFAPAVEGAP